MIVSEYCSNLFFHPGRGAILSRDARPICTNFYAVRPTCGHRFSSNGVKYYGFEDDMTFSYHWAKIKHDIIFL